MKALRADAQRNRTELLKAADATFMELGADASLEQVAKRAGVGIGTLYRHFPDREALLLATLDDSLHGLVALAEKLADADDPGEAFTTWLKAYVKNGTTYQGLSVCLKPLTRSTGETACVAVTRAGGVLLERAQAQGTVRRDIDFEDVGAMVSAVAMAMQASRDAKRAKRLLGLFLDGLQPK